jgi:hypothetical protein
MNFDHWAAYRQPFGLQGRLEVEGTGGDPKEGDLEDILYRFEGN